MTRDESDHFFRTGMTMPVSVMAEGFRYKKILNCSNCRAVLDSTDSTCDNCGTEHA